MAFRFAPLLRRTVTAVARSQKAVPNVAPSLVRGTALVATPVAMRSTTRLFTSSANANVLKSNKWAYYTLFTIATGTAYYQFKDSALAEKAKVDYAKVREAIEKLLDEEGYDDGSYGPVFVRLAWHASGTYDAVNTQTGGSNGATMRFTPECKHGANAGLDVARNRLEAVKKQFPEISYADLWTLAGAVAIETMGGPKINWTPGRSDAESGKACPPDGRLPDASKEHDHVRAIFYRMGFNDREIVALVGAHALGRCHKNRSGYDGPWTNSPTSFSNDFFVQLLERKWTPKKWDGPLQYEDESGALMMLPADLALIKDPEFKKYVEMYAKDEELYFKDFSAAFAKLMELGVPRKAAKSGWFW